MKKLYLLIIISLIIFFLSGCTKFICDDCGKEKSGKSHTIEIYGIRDTLCEDCFSNYGDMGKMFEVK